MKKYPEQLIINKQYLSGFDKICIGLENCESFEVDAKQVVDVCCNATLCNNDGDYIIDDGFIKICPQGATVCEQSFGKYPPCDLDEEMPKDYHVLSGRLLHCCDVTSFCLQKDGCKISIYPPYDTLESVCGGEIEMSNCSSCEFDCDGNFVILFGKSSKAPTRKDNNYHEIVKGWQNVFGKDVLDSLDVQVVDLSMFFGEDDDCRQWLHAQFKTVLNDKPIDFDLMFLGVSDFFAQNLMCQNKKAKLFMSKMADEKIYVGFDGMDLDFRCDEVFEYHTFCKKQD